MSSDDNFLDDFDSSDNEESLIDSDSSDDEQLMSESDVSEVSEEAGEPVQGNLAPPLPGNPGIVQELISDRRPWAESGLNPSTLKSTMGFLKNRWRPWMLTLYTISNLPNPTVHISAVTPERVKVFLEQDLLRRYSNTHIRAGEYIYMNKTSYIGCTLDHLRRLFWLGCYEDGKGYEQFLSGMPRLWKKAATTQMKLHFDSKGFEEERRRSGYGETLVEVSTVGGGIDDRSPF
jgi:hypothetical protein